MGVRVSKTRRNELRGLYRLDHSGTITFPTQAELDSLCDSADALDHLHDRLQTLMSSYENSQGACAWLAKEHANDLLRVIAECDQNSGHSGRSTS